MTSKPKASPETSIVTMWVLLEGDPSVVEIDIDSSKYTSGKFNLDRFKPILKNEFPDELQDVRTTKIEFFNNDDRTTPLKSGKILTNDNTTDENPLVVRYPLSKSRIKVKLRHIHKVAHCKIPHSSGSFDLLQREAKVEFKDDLAEIETCDIYFEDQNEGIKNAFHFNTLLDNIDQNGRNEYILDLKIRIKNRKAYSDWKIGDVLQEIYHYNIDILEMVRVEFDMNSLPESSPSLSIEVQDKIVDQLEDKKFVFEDVNANEATAREFISVILVNTVKFVKVHNDSTTELMAGKQLKGSHGYGPLDYVAMIQKFFMLITEAKPNKVEEGIAQILAQLSSASEMLGKRKLDQTDFEFEVETMPLIGIVTTGRVWGFIRNTGRKIEISKKFDCSYTGNMEDIKIVSSYIVRLLQAQVTEINNRRIKRSCTDHTV